MTGQEELLILRALVEKQKEELAAKDEIIAKQNIRIENMVQALLQDGHYRLEFPEDGE